LRARPFPASPRSADPLRAYLAGPDIFLSEAVQLTERKKAICARHGLIGISPLDPLPGEPADWAALPEWRRIALRNEAHIRSCDLMLANLTPFRGPSADVGTVYEVAFMRSLSRPVFAYATTAAGFTRRTLDFAAGQGGVVAAPDGSLRDAQGMLIEHFGLFDNLMIEAGILASGGKLIAEEIAVEDRWTDLSVFERCVQASMA
jgi:nucleoside 2-deoxyribosyltransferase